MRKGEDGAGEQESKSLEGTKKTNLTKKVRRPRGSRLRNITNRFLESFATDKPGGLRVFDTETRGFAATAYPGGRIVFGVRFGNRVRRRWITLGELGTEVTLSEARARAREIVAESVLGGDPVGDRRRAEAIPLLRAFLDDYAAWSEKTKKARTLRAEAVYRKVAEKRLGSVRLDEIEPAALREDDRHRHLSRRAAPRRLDDPRRPEVTSSTGTPPVPEVPEVPEPHPVDFGHAPGRNPENPEKGSR